MRLTSRGVEPYLWGGIALASATSLWIASYPGLSVGLLLPAIVGVGWIVLGVGWLLDVAHASRTGHAVVTRWLLPPLVFVLVALVSWSLWPDRVRFALSERRLDRAAKQVRSGTKVTGRVGGYRVRTAQTQGRRVIFELPNGPIGGWFLIRAPYHPADFACDHLAADWYLCTEAGFD